MKSITEFLPEVMPSVPGCPVPVAINALRNSVIEFASRTGLLEQTALIDLESGVSEYPIELESGTVPVLFRRGFLDKRTSRVDPASPIELDSENPNWPLLKGLPRHAFIRNGLLTVTPIPVAVGEIEAVFSYTFSRSATRISDEIAEAWIEEVARGALMRLFLMPGVPWANPTLAAAYKTQFDFDVAGAALGAAKGSTTQSIRATPRRFI
jgi:hypothetical protein